MSNPAAAAMPLREALCRLYPGANTKDNWRYACALAERGDGLHAIAELDRENDIAAIVPLPAWAALAEGLGLLAALTATTIKISTPDKQWHIYVDDRLRCQVEYDEGKGFTTEEFRIDSRALVLALLLAAAVKEPTP